MTHVLLPVGLLARRADSGLVIAQAVGEAIGGTGFRRIASGMDRAPSTVRGWLRTARWIAPVAAAALTGLVSVWAADPAMVLPDRPAGQDVLAGLVTVATAIDVVLAVKSLGRPQGWVQAAGLVTRGQLLCRSWWRDRAQHELALTPLSLAGAWWFQPSPATPASARSPTGPP